MSSETFPLINGEVVRVTRVDSCGVPAWGNFVTAISEGFVSVAVTANYDDGSAIQVKNAKGRFCINKSAEAELVNLGIAVVFCEVDPDIYTAITGFPAIVDPATGDTIGFRVNRGIRPSDVRWALETWANATDSAGCDDSGELPYAYLLWPFLSGAKVGDYTIENNAVTFSLTGALTNDGSGWGFGPYEVVTDEAGDPDVLQDAVDDQDHQILVRTVVPPPLPTTGLVPLDDPDEANSTSATPGLPGAFVPAGSVRPETLTALQASSVTGTTGVTAWTTGQYIILGDGSYAHWAGSGATPKWVAGKA